MGLNCTNPGGCRFPKHGMCLASCSFTSGPPPEWDRGEPTQPVELFDEAVWAEFDLARSVDKGPRLAQRDADIAASLDWQALDVIRRAGL